MRKFLLIVFCFIPLSAYSFWIWSPKNQEWKNPKYSALATPSLQYEKAFEFFEEGNYKRAYKEFKKLIVHYPDARESAEAQYYLARTLQELNKPYDAFLEYQKLIDSYPNSQRINEAVEKEYNIGEYFLDREYKKVLGISVYDFVEHPSIHIFKSIVEKSPYSEYAPRAQYKLGIILMQLARYTEARDAFQKVIDNYPESEWATPAKYQLAIATARAFPGTEYDSSYLEEATERLDEFIEGNPDAQISEDAREQLDKLKNKEAKKAFDIAEFYEKQRKYRSALIYYEKVVNNYPGTVYYEKAQSRIGLLKDLIEERISEREYRQIKAGKMKTSGLEPLPEETTPSEEIGMSQESLPSPATSGQDAPQDAVSPPEEEPGEE